MNIDTADQCTEVPAKPPRNLCNHSPHSSSKISQFHNDPTNKPLSPSSLSKLSSLSSATPKSILRKNILSKPMPIPMQATASKPNHTNPFAKHTPESRSLASDLSDTMQSVQTFDPKTPFNDGTHRVTLRWNPCKEDFENAMSSPTA